MSQIKILMHCFLRERDSEQKGIWNFKVARVEDEIIKC